MISKKFASIMMIAGPILTLIMAFTGPLNPNAGVSWSDTQGVLGLLATANTDWAQINFLLLSIGLIMQVLGIRYFVNSMNSNDSVKKLFYNWWLGNDYGCNCSFWRRIVLWSCC